MRFSHFFIERPIFASVLSIVITLAGVVAVFNLPVAQYPPITPPSIWVQCTYPGANARDVADSVAAPIEQQINGVEDMLYMVSQSNNDGSYTLTVTFKPGVNLNFAQVLVQNRINLAMPLLPDVVKQAGVTTRKRNPDILQVIAIYSPHGRYDQMYLSNFTTIKIKDEIARVDGVGDCIQFGQQDYSMRIWLDPDKMASLNLNASDVAAALREQNRQVAAGHFGQPPLATDQPFEFPVTTLGRLVDPADFEDIIIRSDSAGRRVRIKDVGYVRLGARNLDTTSKVDLRPNASLAVWALPDANSIATARAVRQRMEELKKSFPDDIDYTVSLDMTPFIEESINEVIRTLIEAIILVAIVVVVFLQNWRSALIPLVAVPVAVIGTFAVMAAIGFSLNQLTLFGLVLAIGIVVDDAIVVVEAVEHHIEQGAVAAPRGPPGDGPGFRAGRRGGAGAVGGVRAVRVHQRHHRRVLPPVRPDHRRLDGDLGVQLADLEPGAGRHPVAETRRRKGPARPAARPVPGLVLPPVQLGVPPRSADLHRRGWPEPARSAVVLVVYGGLLGLTWWTSAQLPIGYIPNADQGRFYIAVQLPDAASLQRTQRAVRPHCRDHQAAPRRRPRDRNRRPIVHAQRQWLELRPVLRHARAVRRAAPRSADERVRLHRSRSDRLVKQLPEAQVALFTPPAVSGLGTAAASSSSSRIAATSAWRRCRSRSSA